MEISKVSNKSLKKIIRELLNSIRKGGVAVCPTDTVYGILCDAANKKAVDRLFKIKKRPKTKPIPIFVKDLKMAKKLAKIDKKQEKFLKSVWPGKITIVLKRTRLCRGFGGRGIIYGVDKKTIALRIPKYRLLFDLTKQFYRPLTGTSANISGRPASSKIKEVIRQFQNQKLKPDLVIDAGNLKSSKPSKVIDITGPEKKIIRK